MGKLENIQTTKQNKVSEAKRRASAKYDSTHMKLYSVNMPLSLYEIMEKAYGENKKIKNRNAYTIQAIREKLERDGFIS